MTRPVKSGHDIEQGVINLNSGSANDRTEELMGGVASMVVSFRVTRNRRLIHLRYRSGNPSLGG